VAGDHLELRRIITNLVGNAIKFTDAGSVTVTVGTSSHAPPGADLPNPAPPQWVWVSVADTGIGIAAEAQPLLFSKFQQLENVRQREHPGTGLGLALTKQLVELHGGNIKVRSEIGMGSVFTVRLPLQRSAGSLVLDQVPTAEPMVGRIVLVEDNEETASLICDLLTAAAELFAMVGRGAVRIHLNQRYALKDAAQAHRDLEARRTTGSTVLLP